MNFTEISSSILRNGDVNARNFFAPKHDSLKRNQYGGTAGGRIIKDKLFFFGGLSGHAQPVHAAAVDHARSHRGVAHRRLQYAGFGGLSIQRQGADAVQSRYARAVLQQSDSAVDAESGLAQDRARTYLPVSSADGCGKVTYGIPQTGDEDQFIGRVDWVQSSKHTLYGRYFMAQYQNPPVYAGKSADHHAARQLRAGADGHAWRQLHVRPDHAELVPPHLQPPAR